MQLKYFLLMILLFLPIVSAVDLDSGTVLNTTVSNSSMTFLTVNVSADQVEVNTTYIILTNATFNAFGDSYSFSEIRWSKENSNIDSSEFYNLGFIYGLIFQIKLNENNGTIAYDASGNGNNGTISGATWQTDGVTQTLRSGVDYSTTSRAFSILNPEYFYSQITASYYEDRKEDTKEKVAETASGFFNAMSIFFTVVIFGAAILFAYMWFGGGDPGQFDWYSLIFYGAIAVLVGVIFMVLLINGL